MIIDWLRASGIIELAGLLGVIVTVIGFIWTIRSVHKSERAARGAEAAAIDAKNELFRIETFIDLSSAIKSMETIKTLHREKAWSGLGERYAEARRLLIQVKQTRSDLTGDQITLLVNSIGNFAALEKALDRNLEDPNKLNISRANAKISDDSDNLIELLYSLRGEERPTNGS